MYFLLLMSQIFASFTHITAADITQSISPFTVLFLRAGVASLVLLPWLIKKWKMLRRITLYDWILFLILSALNIPINQLLFLVGIKYTTAPNAALAYALNPAFVLIIASFMLEEKISRKKMVGIAIAFVGVIVIFLENGISFSDDYLWGNILVLLASIAWALCTIFGKGVAVKFGPMFSTVFALFGGFWLYLPIYLLIGESIEFDSFTTMNWLEIGYLGVFSSVIGYFIWYYALSKIEAGKVAVINNLQPIITTLLAILFLGHTLTVFFIAGGLLIISGVYVTQKG